jgi:hypothetical protein
MKGTAEGPLAGIWPPGRLELAEWRELLDALAADAERTIGRPGTLQESCTLALRWVGLAWPCMSAEVIAASCRASLQLGEPPGVVVGLPLADQLQEIAERLDSIYEAGQADHSALAVEVRAPVLLAAPGVLPEPEPPKPRKPRRRAGDPDPVEVIEPPAQGPAEVPPIEPEPQQLEHTDPVEVAADVPEALDQPDALEVEHTTPEPEALPQSQLPEALQDAPADPAPQVVELEQQPQAEAEPDAQGQPLDPSPAVEGMPAGWCDAVELAAAAGLGGVTAITSAKRKGRLVEGLHWRKAPPGLKLPGARKPLRLIWQLAACLQVLGTATASERISAEQLRAKVRETIREQGRRRRERRQLAAEALAELQAEGQALEVEQQQPPEPEPPAAPAAPEALEVIEPLQQPDPPAAAPEVPPDVLAAAVAQALQQLGIKTQPAASTNGHREPVPSCWAD